MRFGIVALIAAGLAASPLAARAAEGKKATTAILVDKKTNNLHFCEYVDGAYKIVKTYHATLGQVTGDKEAEGDLKTPEGIYTFKGRSLPPALKPKFGVMAFNMNFPNTYDKMAGRTGSHIMLHATNEPERLKKNYDSEGCVVLNNEEIREIDPRIRLGLTPILIFPELTDEYLKPGQDPALRSFFESWVKDWEGKNLESYIGHYHTDFIFDHPKGPPMDKAAFKAYKGSLNQQYSSIEIGPEDVRYYRHPKYTMITFTQNYRSKRKSGGWGLRSRGTKILYVAEEAGAPRIVAETFTNLMW
jgi:murein L,D-transpeptidase YafK